MDYYIDHGVAKSRTQLSNFHFTGGEVEKEMATHSSILSWRIPWTEGYSPRGCKESDMTDRLL